VEALRNVGPSAKNAADSLSELFEWSAFALSSAKATG
jgi:hypothetical protein